MKRIFFGLLFLMMLMWAASTPIFAVAESKAIPPPKISLPACVETDSFGKDGEDTFTLRLVGALKSADIRAGFEVKMSYQKNGEWQTMQKKLECRYAYREIPGGDKEDARKRLPGDYSSEASYLYALHIQKIPSDIEIQYSITPYITLENGKRITGKVKNFTMKYDDWEKEVPSYDTVGKTTVDGVFSDGMYRTRVRDTSRTEYDAYRAKLLASGYVLYAENEINANAYATYKGERSMVHVYYRDTKKETRILSASIKEMVDYPLAPIADKTVTTPAVALMSVANYGAYQGDNGAGFVFTMPDGSYVIIDGGWGVDTETLYRYLKANNKREDGEILIRAWMITHYHEDHYGNFVNFAKTYAKEVKLEYFVANFDGGNECVSPQDKERVNSVVYAFEGVTYLVPQVGQEMYFGETKFEFLHTQERLYPDYRRTDGNDHSLVAKVTFRGKTFMMMGDAYPSISGIDAEYGEYLKSDFVQAPHHGMGGTSNRFYELVGASYAFINTSATDLEKRLASGDRGNYGALQYLIKELKTPYSVASGGYQIIALE